MAWTDQRIDTLTRMWMQGASAAEISNALGGTSRNAVIAKAHLLGLGPVSDLDPIMLKTINELMFSTRTHNILQKQHIVFIGDLIQRTEVDLLMIEGFGKKSLHEVRSVLSELGLRLRTSIRGWPPADIEALIAKIEAGSRASSLQQTKGGATFQPHGDRFAMVVSGDDSDLAVSLRPVNAQMLSALIEKARNFESVAARLDNQLGWSGIGRSAKSIAELLDRQAEQIPDVLGLLYPAALELGSFMELDQKLSSGHASSTLPLDPEVRRPLTDLVRTLAPWLRSFPTIREADDQASQFLVRASELDSASSVVRLADSHELLLSRDIEVFKQLFRAAERGEHLGEKAGSRAKRSATNLVISAVAVAGSFFSGAISSSYSAYSPIVQKIGQFLVESETDITSLIIDMPDDVRLSVADLIQEFQSGEDLDKHMPVAAKDQKDEDN